MFHGPIYCFLYCMVRFVLFFWHPVLRVQGRENIPQEGRLLICSNHYSMSDPVWIVLAMRAGHIPRIMAKKEARNYPVLGTILEKIGVIFVERGMADVNAIKSGVARRIKAYRVIGAGDIVIDRRRNSDYGYTVLRKLERSAEGTVAADGNNTVNSHEFAVVCSALLACFRHKFRTARGIKHRSAAA